MNDIKNIERALKIAVNLLFFFNYQCSTENDNIRIDNAVYGCKLVS